MRPIVAFTGRGGCGKDTAGDFLAMQPAPDYFVGMKFAEPIYDMVFRLTGIDCEKLDRRAKETPISWIGKSPRELLQTLGTDWGRNMVHIDIWVTLMARDVAALGDAPIVITDCRFDNEAKWVRDQGGIVVKILRGIADSPLIRAHASENGVSTDLITATIGNDGTIDDLHDAVRLVVNEHFPGSVK